MTKNALMALVATVIFAFIFPHIYGWVSDGGEKPMSVAISSVIFFIVMMAAFTLSSRKKG